MTVIGAGWRHLRRQGVRATVRTTFKRFVYACSGDILVRTVLAGPPVPDHVGQVVFRRATSSDLDHLGEFERDGRGSIQRAHVFEDNDWLFVGCHGERIVATRRYSRALPPHGRMARVVDLGSGQVWSADAYCLPEYRNGGLNHHFALFTMRFFASLGYTEQLSCIAVTNVPSLRNSFKRSSSKSYRYVSYFRILFYERVRISDDLPANVQALMKSTSVTPA